MYNIVNTHFKLQLRRNIMSYKLDNLLKQAGDYIRVRELAYFYCHKELLEDKHYNCAYRVLRNAQIKKYAFLTVDDAIRFAEADIEKMLQNYDKEEIEKYRKDIDYLADLSKRYNIADRLDELNIIEY